MRNNIALCIFITISSAFIGCSFKSYCYFNSEKNEIFISNDTANIEKLFIGAKRNSEDTVYKMILTPPQKQYFVSLDSLNSDSIMIVLFTTDSEHHVLEITKNDLELKSVFRFRISSK
jgi:L-cystine uptake protein TcyP (sodium:dicarboxylate symporter family)